MFPEGFLIIKCCLLQCVGVLLLNTQCAFSALDEQKKTGFVKELSAVLVKAPHYCTMVSADCTHMQLEGG